ncbi:flagellar basal body P-ring protein FlgI [Hydrogenovibrio kuenenii]|uniref:flagellar basal body P-ring protein FlgI n=1 Tax=Hydrogenovibrio kuenenii TaxID=63658 RepID=UPI002ADDCCB5|nr:flagellar basal body P-ring protein FlgI [Hydrogenovibrio kuenenii]
MLGVFQTVRWLRKTVNTGFDLGNTITLNLKNSDFTTATNLVNAINSKLGQVRLQR